MGGVAIGKVTDIDSWVEAIEKFDDESYYSMVSHEAKRSVAQYDPRSLIQDLVEVLHKGME